jgi:hypothetical protein
MMTPSIILSSLKSEYIVANALSRNSFINKNLTWQAMIQMKASCLLTGNENIMLLNTGSNYKYTLKWRHPKKDGRTGS